MYIRILLLFLLISKLSAAQLRLSIVNVPKNTPENASIFIAGNFNNWNPNDSTFSLTKNAAGIYSIQIPVSSKSLEFKCTLGSWNSVENSSTGEEIANRVVSSSKDSLLEINIENWKSIVLNSPAKTTKNYFILGDNFPMNDANKCRRIWVYLPQDYATDLTKKYPVLYMHDGQNLFENATAFNGEWGVDETLDSMGNIGNPPLIVVGIDNAGGSDRLDDYSPWKNPEYGGGKGNDYVEFIVSRLKPVIDKLYRTKPDRLHTGIMGSSMAGLITMYAAIKYETTFSKFGVFSPSLWFSDSIYSLPKIIGHQYPSRIYLMSGILESSTQAQETYNMRDSLLAAGYDRGEISCEIKNDGTHSEWFWKREFAPCVKWLFPKEIEEIEHTEPEAHFDLELVPAKNKLLIHTFNLSGSTLVEIKNNKGKVVVQKHISSTGEVNTSKMSKGVYNLSLINDTYTGAQTFEKK